MLIAYDSKRAYHNQRGLGNYSRDLIRLMVQYAPQNRYFLFNPKQQGSIQLPFEQNITQITPQGIWKYLPSLWRSYGCNGQLFQLKPDIYHGLSGELPYTIHRLPCRKIVTIHDAIFMRYPQQYSATYRYVFLQKCRYACHVADTIVAISEQTKRDCIEFFGADPQKIQVIYQGCNNQFYRIVSQSDRQIIKSRYQLPDNYILYVGAAEPNKNIGNLIRAISIAKIDIPLIIVCNQTNYLNSLITLAQQLDIDMRILPNIPFADLPAIYQQATCFAFLSFFEGFGIPVLEAVCSHIPILASSGTCLEETGGNAAIYAMPDNIEHIAQQLNQLLHNRQLRQQLINASYSQAEKFTDPNIANNLIRLYQQ